MQQPIGAGIGREGQWRGCRHAHKCICSWLSHSGASQRWVGLWWSCRSWNGETSVCLSTHAVDVWRESERGRYNDNRQWAMKDGSESEHWVRATQDRVEVADLVSLGGWWRQGAQLADQVESRGRQQRSRQTGGIPLIGSSSLPWSSDSRMQDQRENMEEEKRSDRDDATTNVEG